MAQVIDRRNVQGLIFQSYNYPLARYFLFQFGGAAGARRFLGEFAPRVTHAAQDLAPKPEPLLNIALSWTGLNKAGLLDSVGNLLGTVFYAIGDHDFGNGVGGRLPPENLHDPRRCLACIGFRDLQNRVGRRQLHAAVGIIQRLD